MGKMVAERRGFLSSFVLCLVLHDGQKEARKKQRILGAAKESKTHTTTDSVLWMDSGHDAACRVGKLAVFNCAVHTNCTMLM